MPSQRTFSLSLPPFTKAVKWLILINAGVYFLKILLDAVDGSLGRLIFTLFGLVPSLVTHSFFVWQLGTYSFLHNGLFHLLFNMLALWMFGAQLEIDWGFKHFVEFYMFCVVGAAITTVAVAYTGIGGVNPGTITVGASGGIYGVLMAFGLLYGDNEIMLFPIPISIKAKYFVAGLAFIALASAVSASAPGNGEAIAYSAHLGGLLFGFLYVKLVPKRGLALGASEQYFGIRNSYYRWKRRRAARKFEVYMRKEHNQKVSFDEHGNYIPPEEHDKKNGGSKSGWVN